MSGGKVTEARSAAVGFIFCVPLGFAGMWMPESARCTTLHQNGASDYRQEFLDNECCRAVACAVANRGPYLNGFQKCFDLNGELRRLGLCMKRENDGVHSALPAALRPMKRDNPDDEMAAWLKTMFSFSDSWKRERR